MMSRFIKETSEYQILKQLLLAIFTLVISYLLYWIWFVPLNRVRTLYDIGYTHLVDENKKLHYRKEIINRFRRSRQEGNLPPSYPNGWYILRQSQEVKCGDVVSISALGLQLTLYRGKESGKVFVTDAYCPHLGADLSAGGRVKGDCIECPFHGWKFEGNSGTCVEIPNVKKIPEGRSKIKTYTCLELNQLIYMWYHCEDVDPTWCPDKISQLNPGDNMWSYRGRTEYQSACHIQDILENGADLSHFDSVHGSPFWNRDTTDLNWIQQKLEKCAMHVLNSKWKPNQESGQQHKATICLKHRMNFFGLFDILDINFDIEQVGPSMIHLTLSSFLGSGILIIGILPHEPMLQRIVHVFYTELKFIAPIAKIVLFGESRMFERDIKVWNSKKYTKNPIFTSYDAQLVRHRRWYNKFYSESSKTFIDSGNTDNSEW